MMARADKEFLAGVIEGFYGEPWSPAARLELFRWMAAWGLNTYLYAPKNDLKHRADWRSRYSAGEAAALGQLIRACRRRRIRFVFALSPGLSIRYGNNADLSRLKLRCKQMLDLGCRHFALLFDDLPDGMNAERAGALRALASAQCRVANALLRWVRERHPAGRFLFCPTLYCGRMAQRLTGGAEYLSTIGRELAPEIDVLWTGPEIVSRQITVPHVRKVRQLLRRKPLIWDNLHANDYDGRRFYCGPYSGRPPELRGEVSGLLSNPNNEFPLNYVPLRTLARFVQCGRKWDARKAYLSAMREWLPRFATVGRPVALRELVRFGDCYYLPHQEGPEAKTLLQRAAGLLSGDPARGGKGVAAFWSQAARLREFCTRLTALRDRALFCALSRRAWELGEELDLLERCIECRSGGASGDGACRSDFHLYGTYRGGVVARMQALLVQQSDGALVPARRRRSATPVHPRRRS